MQKLKTIFQVNNLVLVGALVFAIVLGIDTFKAINNNYQLAQEYDKLQAQIKVQELTNQNLKLNNQYLQSKDYLDLAVRSQLDLSAPGDKELVFTHLPAPASQSAGNDSKNAKHLHQWQQNFNDWVDFLLHRRSSFTPSD